jgi:hypothetical protein
MEDAIAGFAPAYGRACRPRRAGRVVVGRNVLVLWQVSGDRRDWRVGNDDRPGALTLAEVERDHRLAAPNEST